MTCELGAVYTDACICQWKCDYLLYTTSCIPFEDMCDEDCKCPEGLLQSPDLSCVTQDQCPCVDDQGNYYNPGDPMDSEDPCQVW